MSRTTSSKVPVKGSGRALESLTPDERAGVLARLLAAHPGLVDEAERFAGELLSSPSADMTAAEVERALTDIPLPGLAARAGRVPGRGFVHETDAAWELVEEALEPFLSDLERRAKLGFVDAATTFAVGCIAGLYRTREPEVGTVLAYAGEDAPATLATEVIGRSVALGLVFTNDTGEKHWPAWDDLT